MEDWWDWGGWRGLVAVRSAAASWSRAPDNWISPSVWGPGSPAHRAHDCRMVTHTGHESA